MPFAPTSPVAGAVESGFTNPTYTLVSDGAVEFNVKQYAISALGGTQAGVTAHSVASPFTSNLSRPKNLRVLGTPNPITGVITNVPRNVYQSLTRKGVLPLAGQPYQVMLVRTSIEVPAGADLADAPNVKAAQSCHIGILWESSNDIGDATLNGVI